MNRRRKMTAAAAALGMLVLILDSRCALESARQALLLCIRTVIPSLFPFLFLSGLITALLWGNSGVLMCFPARMMGLPKGAESLFPAAFLGGYPAGAAAIGSAYYTGRLQKEEAQQLLSFCSNAGPAFLFGMIAPQFPRLWMGWCLWLIHLVSAAMVGSLLPRPERIRFSSQEKVLSSRAILWDSIKTMGMICGWILLFRILLGYLDRWILWLLPPWGQVLIWGLLELSNGCCVLTAVRDISVRFVIAAAMVSFGGLCVTMQTASVIFGLSMKQYLAGKLLQTLFSILLALAAVMGWWIPGILLCAAALCLRKTGKKSSSNLTLSGV